MTLTQTIEAEIAKRGWAGEDWKAETHYQDIQIRPTAYVADRERRSAMAFTLKSVLDNARLTDGENEVTVRYQAHEPYLYDGEGKIVTGLLDVLRTGSSGRWSDELTVVGS